jgi:hypothetical protein
MLTAHQNLGDVNFQNLHLSRVIASTSGLIASPTMAPSLDNYTTPIGLEGCPIPTVGNAKSVRMKSSQNQSID